MCFALGFRDIRFIRTDFLNFMKSDRSHFLNDITAVAYGQTQYRVPGKLRNRFGIPAVPRAVRTWWCSDVSRVVGRTGYDVFQTATLLLLVLLLCAHVHGANEGLFACVRACDIEYSMCFDRAMKQPSYEEYCLSKKYMCKEDCYQDYLGKGRRCPVERP